MEKKRRHSKKVGRQRTRRTYGHLTERMMRKIFGVFREMAADHAEHTARFFSFIETEVEEVERAADAILEHPEIRIDEKYAEEIAYQYSMFFIFMFTPLADHLGYDEERRYVEDVGRLNIAWQKLFAAVKLRRDDLAERADRIQLMRRTLADYLADYFLGEIRPVLPRALVVLSEQLTPELKALFKELEP